MKRIGAGKKMLRLIKNGINKRVIKNQCRFYRIKISNQNGNRSINSGNLNIPI
jgi:hypothetical protein